MPATVRDEATEGSDDTVAEGCEDVDSCMRPGSIVNPPRRSYETHRDPESTMTDQPAECRETWLRGNMRPVTWLAALAALITFGLFAVVAVAAASSPVAWLLLASLCAVMAAIIGTLCFAAARPRLECLGDRLRIRLSPTGVHDVPLDAVECFFQGSNPIDRSGEPTCGEHAVFRVNTLVMRMAERAADFSTRPTFTPWGTWDDGYVVFDGRWCEPLSAELARRLSRQLVDAKRAASSASPVAGVGP